MSTEVYLSTDLHTLQPIILKKFERSSIQDQAHIAFSLWKHVRGALTNLLAPDILEFDVSHQLSEFIPGGDLYIVEERLDSIEVPLIRYVIKNILFQIEVLMEQGLVHSDVKPGNIVLLPSNDQGLIVTMIDFDFMQPLRNPSHLPFGTPYFMSPEALDGEPSSTSDAFSLAMTALDLLNPPNLAACGIEDNEQDLSRRRYYDWPFSHAKNELQKQLLRCTPHYESEIHGLLNFVFSCLKLDPLKRPQSAKEMRDILMDTGNLVAV